MEKEEQLLKKRIQELAALAYERDVPTHTDFLNLNEQTIFHAVSGSLPPVRYELTGGFEEAERKVVCFLPSYGETLTEPPFDCLKIEPNNAKFAGTLTHRDYLGAIMNLGIERGMLGDILVDGTNAYVFVLKHMSGYLTENLVMIGRTGVSACPCEEEKLPFSGPKFEVISGSVSSLRLDSIVALAGHLSRSHAVPYIEGEKVFLNGQLTVSNHCQLKDGDILSIRGIGKFRFAGVEKMTKKGRCFVTLYHYQ